MKNVLILLLTLTVTSFIYSQESYNIYDTVVSINGDTLLITKCIDTLKPKSKLNQKSISNGYRLVEINSIECDDMPILFKIKPFIYDEIFKGDTLIISVGFTESCNVNFLCEISAIDNSINLVYNTYCESCECLCKRILTYKIIVRDKGKFEYFLNGDTVFTKDKVIEFDIVDGDTINYRDEFWRFYGKWKKYDENGNIICDLIYKNQRKTGITYQYYKNGSLNSERYYKDGNYYRVKYYRDDGTLKRDCNDPKQISFLDAICIEYDEKGDIVE